MPMTQFGGQGKAVGAVLGPLAGLSVAAGNPVLMMSDLVKAECEIDTNHEAWGQVATRMSTGAPRVVVVILIALNVLLKAAVLWLLSARKAAGGSAV